ncbi:hypothetical protein [Streptomyces sp. NBC_00151]|uniref:hypothetical protein n=1 Tax=Streptomyces sp. NBC_00151 TaxID=2975669 RepID=UPI002DDC0C80|nr:hypothetical protein [Streptomyces sp. NBC_00151]WRZ42814.1 hypothetical protein OG915_35125 [Streptomyces sp. NBC_00151]
MGTAPAFGDAGENLDSAHYYYGTLDASAWSHLSEDNKAVHIKDEAGDGRGVYTLYDRRDDTGLRLNNNNGHGSTVSSGSSTANYVRKVTACMDIALLPDECGPDDRPGDGR